MHVARWAVAMGVAFMPLLTSATRGAAETPLQFQGEDVEGIVATRNKLFLQPAQPGAVISPAISSKQWRKVWAQRLHIAAVRQYLHECRDWVYNAGFAKLPSWAEWILHVTMSWVIFMLLGLLVWMNYYPDDPDLQLLFDGTEENDPVKTFTDSKFGCFKTPTISLWACLCPALRWADNVNMAGFLRLPVALGVFFTCSLLNGLTGTFCYFGFITCFMILFYRHKLRARLGLPSFTTQTCCVDFFYVFCCSWCAIAQEARVVRLYYQQGTLSLTSGRRYMKSELPDRPFPMVSSSPCEARRMLAPPPEPAPLAAQRLVAEVG